MNKRTLIFSSLIAYALLVPILLAPILLAGCAAAGAQDDEKTKVEREYKDPYDYTELYNYNRNALIEFNASSPDDEEVVIINEVFQAIVKKEALVFSTQLFFDAKRDGNLLKWRLRSDDSVMDSFAYGDEKASLTAYTDDNIGTSLVSGFVDTLKGLAVLNSKVGKPDNALLTIDENGHYFLAPNSDDMEKQYKVTLSADGKMKSVEIPFFMLSGTHKGYGRFLFGVKNVFTEEHCKDISFVAYVKPEEDPARIFFAKYAERTGADLVEVHACIQYDDNILSVNDYEIEWISSAFQHEPNIRPRYSKFDFNEVNYKHQ